MKRLQPLVLVVAIVALLSGSAHAQGGPGDGGIFSTVLSNGLQVVVVEDHAAPVVQTGMWYRFGSIDETAGKTGLAHALEHMMYRGSEHISAGGLDDVVTRMGAEMNGETNYDYTQFYFEMPSDKLDVALYIESDRMAHALIAQSGWNIERGAVLNEIEGDESSPFYTLLERVRAAAFPNQPSGRTPLGYRKDVEAATAKDIAKYYHEWYAPNNATLVVAGDVDHTTVFAKAQKYFGAIPSHPIPKRPDVDPVPAPGGAVESQLPYPFEVVDLAYSVPGDTEAGEPEINTLATLIQNQRSPFYQSLVQTNVALAVEAQEDTQLKGGLLDVFITLNPGHTATEAESIFEATMHAQIQNGFSPDLVSAAKHMTIADRIFSGDSIDGIGDLAGYTYGLVREKLSDEDNRLAAITPLSIQSVAARYLSTPTVIGHLSPNDSPSQGSSQKNTAAATDDFSKRAPSGPIVEPAWVQAAVRAPTAARSALHPVSFTLPNGLHVLVQEKHDRRTFELTGSIASSSAFEPVSKEGTIEVASTVADDGSAKYPFAARRAATDEMGAYVQTGQEFSVQGLSKDFDALVDIIADGEEHPTFAEPWFTLNRDQIANSIESQASVSGTIIDRAYAALLSAPNDPSLRQPTPTSVSSLTASDLLAFTKAYWRPDLTTIAVVGDVTPEQVRSVLTAAFGSWSASGPTPDAHELGFPSAKGGHDFVETAASQVYVRLGQPGLARNNPDYDAFLVLNQILGASGAFESRLWQELRQKRGLVYSVDSSITADADRGDLRIELNASPSRIPEAVAFVRSELKTLQTHPVSPVELAEAKGRIVSDALIAEASADGQAEQLLDIGINGLPIDYYATLNDRYDRITAADVERVAKKYLRPDQLVQIYAGPTGAWANSAL